MKQYLIEITTNFGERYELLVSAPDKDSATSRAVAWFDLEELQPKEVVKVFELPPVASEITPHPWEQLLVEERTMP